MRPSTHSQIASTVRRLSDSAKSEDLGQFDRDTVREFLYHGREHLNWSARTFRIYWQYLKTFFDWAESEAYVRTNPLNGIAKPPVPKTLPRCLTKDQALKFLTHARWVEWTFRLEPVRNESIVAFFLYTGIRLQELIDLEESEVNLHSNEACIRKGKGQKDRVVALHPRLRPLLRAYAETKAQHGHPSRWFFNSVRSPGKLTPKNVQQVFLRISQKSGVKVTPHMLRHTFGRRCVEENVNMRVIQTMMGHADITTTEVYTHVSQETMKKTIGAAPLF